jgi:hypothetical protein
LTILPWGITVLWPFFIYSMCFICWKEESIFEAFYMTFTLHAMHNSLPAIILYFMQTST